MPSVCKRVSHCKAANAGAGDYDVEAGRGAASTVERGECFVVGAWMRKREFELWEATICSDLCKELSRSDLGGSSKEREREKKAAIPKTREHVKGMRNGRKTLEAKRANEKRRESRATFACLSRGQARKNIYKYATCKSSRGGVEERRRGGSRKRSEVTEPFRERQPRRNRSGLRLGTSRPFFKLRHGRLSINSTC